MIPRTLRMAAIGHYEKRRPRTREMPPAQLVAYKNPPASAPEPVQEDLIPAPAPEPVQEDLIPAPVEEEEEEDPMDELMNQVGNISLNEDTESVMSDLTDDFPQSKQKQKKGYYNDADAPKADVIVPDYGTAEDIQMAVSRISKKKAAGKGKKAGKADKTADK